LESIKNMSLTAHGLGKPPPKASNSSRIRARSIQNTSQKNSRNVTFETHKKNMSITAHGLGKPPAKASNSSKIRARSMQNISLKNSRNVTFGIHKKKTCLSRHMALENRLRKPRTAAGFVPEACKTQA